MRRRGQAGRRAALSPSCRAEQELPQQEARARAPQRARRGGAAEQAEPVERRTHEERRDRHLGEITRGHARSREVRRARRGVPRRDQGEIKRDQRVVIATSLQSIPTPARRTAPVTRSKSRAAAAAAAVDVAGRARSLRSGWKQRTAAKKATAERVSARPTYVARWGLHAVSSRSSDGLLLLLLLLAEGWSRARRAVLVTLSQCTACTAKSSAAPARRERCRSNERQHRAKPSVASACSSTLTAWKEGPCSPTSAL